jgi:arylsulfatase A-like enzyme
MRRFRYHVIVCALLVFTCCDWNIQIAMADDRPNIVLIMADDLGFSDLGCYGGEIETRNLDSLARDGMLMTQFYNCAKCTTTRAALVTGRYPRPRGGLLEMEDLTIGELMKSAGYSTSLSGKWHLGHSDTTHPFRRGFDRFYGLLDGCCNFFDPSIPDPKFKGGRVRVFAKDDTRITEFPDDFYTTTAFTDHATESIELFSKKEQPFFLHVTYTAPHYPLHAPEATIKKYLGKYRGGWHQLRQSRWKRQQELGLFPRSYKLSPIDSRSYDWETAEQEWEDRRMATYAAMIDEMDGQIGRIVKSLRDAGELDNTLLMFFADNGGCAEEPGGRVSSRVPGPKEFYTAVGPSWGWAQNTPFKRYKQWVNEGGISSPMIAHWPRTIAKGSKSDAVGHVMDLPATCAELANIQWPKTYQGRSVQPVEGLSMLPVLNGDDAERHKMLFWEWSGNKALRHSNWKYVYDKLEKRWALYDIVADRTETQDLSGKYPDLSKEFRDAWELWGEQTGVSKSKDASKQKNQRK